MTPPPVMTCLLHGTDSDGLASAITVPVSIVGEIRRSVGLAGDTLTVQTSKWKASDGTAQWPPADWDLSKDISIEFGLEGSEITLGGYRLIRDDPFGVGIRVPDNSGTGLKRPQLRQLTLATLPAIWRDGRGGRITVGTLNPVDSDGIVDVSDPDYKTNSELVAICAAALGISTWFVDPDIDDIDPPGPLDWGNARALDELEGVLARAGYIAVLRNAGDSLGIFRLPFAGETQTLPVADPDLAEPYELGSHPAIRGRKVVVTSGRTRTTIVTERSLEVMEWLARDDRTNTWGNSADWASDYPSEIGPDDIDAYRAGPPKDEKGRRQWARLFSAVGIADADDWKRTRRMIPLPGKVNDGDDAITNAAAIVFAQAVVPYGSNQLRNEPSSGSTLLRFDGATVHSPDGVIELPRTVEFVRMSPGPAGTREHAIALTSAQLKVLFAHEAHTDERLHNYYWRGFIATIDAGALLLTPITDDAVLEAAIDDPDTLVIEAPFLHRIVKWLPAASDPTEINKSILDDLAEQLARTRAAGDLAKSGVARLRGLQPREPGSYGGAASSVTWRMRGELLTVIALNEHDAPQSFLDQLARDAERSYASGLRRFSQAGSSAAMSDVRGGSTPGAALVAGLGGGTTVSYAGASATRGAEERIAGAAAIATPMTAQTRAIEEALWAEITGATSLGNNRWRYNWKTVAASDTALVWSAAGTPRTQATDGYAYNTMEVPNNGSGVEGNGVDRANLPAGFAMKPIATGTIVRLYGPYGSAGTKLWYFSAINSDDGECS